MEQPGYLTLPVGAGDPGAYVYNHQFVYAYRSLDCAPQSGDAASESSATTTPSACLRWIFVDPKTGEDLDMIWTK